MKFMGIDVFATLGDSKRFVIPKLKVGDKIEFLHNDESCKTPFKTVMIKKGVYTVKAINQGVNWPTYHFVKNKKDYVFCQVAIDKAIEYGFAQFKSE
jgi:hypothetical protein